MGNKYNVTSDPSSRWVDLPPVRFTADVNRILRDDSEEKDRGCINDGPNAYDSVHELEVKTTRAVITRDTTDTRDEERQSSIVPSFGLTTGGGSRYLNLIAIVSVPRL